MYRKEGRKDTAGIACRLPWFERTGMESKCLSVSMNVNAMVWYVREWRKERKGRKRGRKTKRKRYSATRPPSKEEKKTCLLHPTYIIILHRLLRTAPHSLANPIDRSSRNTCSPCLPNPVRSSPCGNRLISLRLCFPPSAGRECGGRTKRVGTQ